VLGLAYMLVTARPVMFELSLPVHGRQLQLARTLPSIGVALVPLGAWTAAAVLSAEQSVPIWNIVQVALSIAAVVMLPVVVAPRSADSRYTAKSSIGAVVVIGVSIAMFWYLPGWTGAMVLGLYCAVALAWMAYRIPAGLQTAHDGVIGDAVAPLPTARDTAVPEQGQHPVLRLVQRQLAHPIVLFAIVMGMFYGLGGRLDPMMLIIASVITEVLRSQLQWVGGLPISSRVHLLLLLTPLITVLLAFAGGHAIERAAFGFVDEMADGAVYNREGVRSTSLSRVRMVYWRTASGGRVPLVTSPWGETVRPDAITVGGRTLYNPYSATKANSERFAEWQFQRATTAVYGAPISQTAYRALDKYPAVRLRGLPFELLQLTWAAACLLGMVFLLDTMRVRRPGRAGGNQIIGWTVNALFLAFIAVYFLTGRQYGGSLWDNLLEILIVHVVRALHNSTLLVAGVCAASLLLIYRVVEWQHGRVEQSPGTMIVRRTT
jgi:hypothetical protein